MRGLIAASVTRSKLDRSVLIGDRQISKHNTAKHDAKWLDVTFGGHQA